MPTIKGNRLYVELGASQVRRRLKGHGFGVRKVETAGRQRAVIIHTATGQQQRKLESLFRDVLAEPAHHSSLTSDDDRNFQPRATIPPIQTSRHPSC